MSTIWLENIFIYKTSLHNMHLCVKIKIFLDMEYTNNSNEALIKGVFLIQLIYKAALPPALYLSKCYKLDVYLRWKNTLLLLCGPYLALVLTRWTIISSYIDKFEINIPQTALGILIMLVINIHISQSANYDLLSDNVIVSVFQYYYKLHLKISLEISRFFIGNNLTSIRHCISLDQSMVCFVLLCLHISNVNYWSVRAISLKLADSEGWNLYSY